MGGAQGERGARGRRASGAGARGERGRRAAGGRGTHGKKAGLRMSPEWMQGASARCAEKRVPLTRGFPKAPATR
jgi:hypothetical protein